MLNLSQLPVSTLVKALDIKFEGVSWVDYEVETLLLELGSTTGLLRDKLLLTQALIKEPDLSQSDIMFFLHASVVMSNQEADFENFPIPNSLEIAFCLEELTKLVGKLNFTDDIRIAVEYILRQEGYSVAPYPFTQMGSFNLTAGQTQKDIDDKQKGIEKYVQAMYSKS